MLKAAGGLWYRVADIQLHIGIEEGVPPSKRHPAFDVENVERVRAYLEERGVRTRDEPSIAGVGRFSFFDPFGNRIEFLEAARRDRRSETDEDRDDLRAHQ